MSRGTDVSDSERELIRRNLVAYRGQLGATQQDLADFAGVTVDAIRSYEGGRRVPDRGVLIALSRTFGCTVEDFFAAEPVTLDATKRSVVRYKVLGQLDDDLRAELEKAVAQINRVQVDRIHQLKRRGREGKKL